MTDLSKFPTRIPTVLEDPSTKSLATVYADAFLDTAGDATGAERLAELQEFLVDVFDANPQFETLLTSPRIPQSEKVAILERAVLPHVSPLFARFLNVLAARDRLELLRPIYAVGVTLQETRSGRKKVIVRTAAELSDDQLGKIRETLSQKLSAEPVIHVEIDPTLIGGLVIQVGDTVYDSSLRNRLGQLQSRLRQRYVHEIQSGRDRFSYSEGS